MNDRENVMQFRELSLDLIETRFVGDEQPDAAGLAIGERRARNGFEIEGAAGEQTGDVRHRAGMVAHAELEHDGPAGVGGGGGSECRRGGEIQVRHGLQRVRVRER